ncbi:hypothetical protein AB2969_004770, partial [Escherichia coli]|nr:hypothetical protein [Escherichia coli]EIT7527463.1 hypothetical protein [Escherichia coli]
MNNVLLIELVPTIVKAIWKEYGYPRRENSLPIPKEVDATVAPGITCRLLTEAIDKYIEQYPKEAVNNGLVVWFGELLCYKRSAKMDKEHDIFVSCHGKAYQREYDGHLTELPHEIVDSGSNRYWRYMLPWAEGRLNEMSHKEVDNNSISPHRTICYFPGNPIPKLWSRLFDARRNGIPSDMKKSGGVYYVRVDGQLEAHNMSVEERKNGKVYPCQEGESRAWNHIADHVFNDTAQAPGVHMWFDCRLVLPDINLVNIHVKTNDGDFVTWPLQQGFTQQVQYEPWTYMEYTQFATHDQFQFDRVGDRAIRYYHQMLEQYFAAIDAGCKEVDPGMCWCEAMK